MVGGGEWRWLVEVKGTWVVCRSLSNYQVYPEVGRGNCLMPIIICQLGPGGTMPIRARWNFDQGVALDTSFIKYAAP